MIKARRKAKATSPDTAISVNDSPVNIVSIDDKVNQNKTTQVPSDTDATTN